MPNAHNLRRRNPWPRAAGQQRRLAEQTAKDHAENLRDTLRKVAALKSAHPDLVVALTEIERDIAIAALAFDDIRRLMEEAAAAAAGPASGDSPGTGG